MREKGIFLYDHFIHLNDIEINNDSGILSKNIYDYIKLIKNGKGITFNVNYQKGEELKNYYLKIGHEVLKYFYRHKTFYELYYIDINKGQKYLLKSIIKKLNEFNLEKEEEDEENELDDDEDYLQNEQKVCFILIKNCKSNDLIDIDIDSILKSNSSYILIYEDHISKKNEAIEAVQLYEDTNKLGIDKKMEIDLDKKEFNEKKENGLLEKDKEKNNLFEMNNELFPIENLRTIDNIYTILSPKIEDLFSTTYTVRHKQTQAQYLLEVFKDNAHDIQANQIVILKNINNINNPNIIKLIDYGNGPIVLNEEHAVKRPYIVYENILNRDLFSYITGFPPLGEMNAKLIFRKILNGVNAMHKANICHRDLKIENILLDDHFNPKIYGFYFSCMNMDKLTKKVGTQNYIAPEIIMSRPYNGIKADIFSLGVSLFNLVTGQYGFTTANILNKHYKLIIGHNYDQFLNQIAILNLSQSFKNLFIKMIDYNPNNRPTIDEILTDEWMQEINNLNKAQMDALNKKVYQEFAERERIININRIKNITLEDNTSNNCSDES